MLQLAMNRFKHAANGTQEHVLAENSATIEVISAVTVKAMHVSFSNASMPMNLTVHISLKWFKAVP